MSEAQQKVNINWVQTLAGALAAMSSAVLLSTVGVAGTLIGAAVGSVVVTLGNAVYEYSLQTSKKRVAVASATAKERAARARARKKGASASSSSGVSQTEQMDLADQDLDQAEEDLEQVETEGPQRASWKEIARGLNWKRIGLVALGIFAIAMAAIFTFELITGRSVSTYTGGSDDKGTGSSIDFGNDNEEPAPTSTPGETPTVGPSETPSETPTEDPTEEPTSPAEEAAPTEDPTSEPTDEPAEEPTSGSTTPLPSPPPVSPSGGSSR
ncbi:MAG TPA: hypothetical protein VFD59_17260 [Nocardioidaceae bacterium]|nr:hypothetical protein [Nocardioidaceae bacterium]